MLLLLSLTACIFSRLSFTLGDETGDSKIVYILLSEFNESEWSSDEVDSFAVLFSLSDFDILNESSLSIVSPNEIGDK